MDYFVNLCKRIINATNLIFIMKDSAINRINLEKSCQRKYITVYNFEE